MKLIKPIIAVFLLLTYSFAFAVESIPHCHVDNHVEYLGFGEEKNHHGNHNHVEIENKGADDVLHANHLDDSLLDFVICLLSELEHPESSIFQQHINTSNIGNVDSRDVSEINMIAVLASIFIRPVTIETNNEFAFAIPYLNRYKLLIVESSPHRGPPAISC
ncbi:MAG: hypothetical protein J5I47_01795 [Vicingus serpentipes]|nr:hypothetical protein [Vicingus serpentipes]